jgi:hypothetical protein
MLKKRVFISSRIEEIRDFREAAVRAIESAGMEPIYFATIDPQKVAPLTSDLEHITELLDAVKNCDIFLGLYGQTLDPNWTPEGYSKHSMELEQETAESIGLRCFYYVEPLNVQCDHDMTRFRQQIMQKAAQFLTTPDELYRSLFAQLSQL